MIFVNYITKFLKSKEIYISNKKYYNAIDSDVTLYIILHIRGDRNAYKGICRALRCERAHAALL